jgi:hypothetical protein
MSVARRTLRGAYREPARKGGTVPTLELSREQIVAEMERVARRRRHTSAAEVVRQYRAGTLEAPGELADLLVLGDLLDSDDEYSTAS